MSALSLRDRIPSIIERPVGVDWLPNITGVHKAIGLCSSETIV